MAKPTLLLYPGAGSDRDHSSLRRIEADLGSLGRRPATRLPVPPGRASRRPTGHRSCSPRSATTSPRSAGVGVPIVMGGRSMGGRMTTMVAADVDGGGPVARLAGLVLICYPLHPPGKPDQLRVEHLPAIDVPCLFISGTNDPFGVARRTRRVDGHDPRPGRPRVDRTRAPRSQGGRRERSPMPLGAFVGQITGA